MFIYILFFLGLGYTLYTDVKDREIALYTLILLVVTGGFIALKQQSLTTIGLFWILNVVFIGIQYGLLMVYLEIRYKEGRQIFSKWIGLGDLLFFLAISVYYPTNTFVFVYLACLLFSALVFLSLRKYLKTIPLAGFSALFILLYELYILVIQ